MRHFYLDTWTPGTYRVIVGRHGGKYFKEFATYQAAVDWIVRNDDSDEHYIAALENPDGTVVHDHFNPMRDWNPALPEETT